MDLTEALDTALEQAQDGVLPITVYSELEEQLSETERDMFAMSLASQGVLVMPQEKQAAFDMLSTMRALTPHFLTPSDYSDIILDASPRVVVEYNKWLLNSGIRIVVPLKRKRKSQPITDDYKREVKRQVRRRKIGQNMMDILNKTQSIKSTKGVTSVELMDHEGLEYLLVTIDPDWKHLAKVEGKLHKLQNSLGKFPYAIRFLGSATFQKMYTGIPEIK